MSKKQSIIWPADPHTVAKIAILKGYLKAWFRILGMTRPGETILYVDGFAGPGHYRNHEEGSPLAAVRVAEATLAELGDKFVARRLHCAFIEKDAQRFAVLSEAVKSFEEKPRIGVTKKCCTFADGIVEIGKEVPGPFRGEGPVFVFADPFGGTGIPLQTMAACMRGSAAELLINLDVDGVARIFCAEDNNNREEQLTELFGDESWRTALTARGDIRRLGVQILDLYKERLRSLQGVKFIWSFAMRGARDAINYHLVFATKHPLGMEKMKEAMKAIDRTGSYSFSDAHVNQHVLFRTDDERIYADKLFNSFKGKSATWEEVYVFALSETPFLNPKTMLAYLEKEGRLQVDTRRGVQRRAFTFPEEKIESFRFVEVDVGPKQVNMFT